jgi:hypothetical protein
MIPCKEVIEQIGELLPDLKGEASEELRHHLDNCPACRAYLEACQLAEHLGGLPLPHAPGHVQAVLEKGHAVEPPE